MTKIILPTYWVLIKETDETVATCKKKEIADWIAENFPIECNIRVTFQEIKFEG